MDKVQTNQYLPDYLTFPGQVLEDYLENYGISQDELADRTGLDKKIVNEIIKGKAPITSETALKLERILGRPAHFWNNLEITMNAQEIRCPDCHGKVTYFHHRCPEGYTVTHVVCAAKCSGWKIITEIDRKPDQHHLPDGRETLLEEKQEWKNRQKWENRM